MSEPSRRELLRATGATAGGVALSGLSGCLDAVPFLGGSPAYAAWLVAPDEIDRDHYQFGAFDVPTILDHESELNEESTLGGFEERFEDADGIDAADLDSVYIVGPVVVLRGEYDREAFAEYLEDNDVNEDGDHQGYTLYEAEETYWRMVAAALGDETVVYTASPDGLDVIEPVLDAEAGEQDRYGEENEDCSELLGVLGDETVVLGETYDEVSVFDDVVATGAAWTTDGDTAELTAPVVFEEGDADPDTVEDTVDDLDFFDEFEDTSVGTQGRTAVVTGTVDTDEIPGLEVEWVGGGRTTQAPQAAFSVEYDPSMTTSAETGVVTITHDGGATIDANELSIRGTGFTDPDGASPDVTRSDMRWGVAGGTANGERDGDPAVVSGDYITVGAASDYDIRVVWEAESGAASATLASAAGPDTA